MTTRTWELPEVRQEQAFHLRDFTGRDALLESIDRWIDETDRGGFLLLVGGPGVGKSALAAAIAARHDALLHMAKAHPGPIRVLSALASAAAHRAGVAVDSGGGDRHDLRNALVGHLERLVAESGSVVVVLDALDEMEDAADLDVVPAHLPPGVRFILTARPSHAVTRGVRARCAPLREIAVPPLSPSEIRALALRRDPTSRLDPARLAERTGGLPILVRRALDLVEGGARDDAAIPASLEELFDGVHRAIVGGDAGRGDVLALLCCAREALDARAVSSIGAPDLTLARCREHLAAMAAFLLEVRPGAFVPWHRGLADFVRESVLGPAGVRAVEARFAAWTTPSADRAPDPYALRHRTSHLEAAGQVDVLRAELEDDALLRARIEAGHVFDVVADLERHLGKAASVRALRRHAHFLARRPDEIATVLARDVKGAPVPLRRIVERGAAPDADPAELFTLLGHAGEVFDVAVSPDGARIASASADGTVRIWDLASGRPHAVRKASSRRALAVAFTADGRVLVGCDGEGLLRCDGEGAVVDRWAPDESIWSVTSCPGRAASEELTLTGSRAGEVCLWGGSGERRGSWVPGGIITTVAIAPDGRRIVAGSTWDRILVVNLDEGGATTRTLTLEARATPWTVALRPGGTVVAACADGFLREWSAAGDLLVERAAGQERLHALALTADGVEAAVAGSTGALALVALDRADPETATVARIVAHRAAVHALAIGADQDGEAIVVSASADRVVRGFRLRDLRARWAAVPPADGEPSEARARVTASAFSADGALLAAGTYDGVLHLRRSASGERMASRRMHASRIAGLAFSADGAWIATASQDGTTKLLRVARPTGAPIALVGHEGAVNHSCFVGPGRVATASSDQTVRLWSIFGARALRVWRHADAVAEVASDEAGRRVAGLARDGRIGVWNVDDPEDAPAFTIDGTPRAVALALVDGGDAVRVVLQDGSIRAWTLAPAPRERRGAELEAAGTFSWIASAEHPETLLRDATGRLVAAYPWPLATCCASPDGRRLAGWLDGELHLVHHAR